MRVSVCWQYMGMTLACLSAAVHQHGSLAVVHAEVANRTAGPEQRSSGAGNEQHNQGRKGICEVASLAACRKVEAACKRAVPPLLHQHNRQTPSPVRNPPELTRGRTLAASTCCRRGRGGDGQVAAGSFLSEHRWEHSLLGANCSRAAAAAAQPRGRRGLHLCTSTAGSPPVPRQHCDRRIQLLSLLAHHVANRVGVDFVLQTQEADGACKGGPADWRSSLFVISYCGQYRGPALNNQQRLQQHAACCCTTSACSGHGRQHPP